MRPFVDRPVADVDGASRLAASAARDWGLDAPHLLRHGMNAIFAAGDDAVIRVGCPTAPASASIALARALDAHGIRVVLPLVDEVVGNDELRATCWERVPTGAADIDWHDVGAIVRRVHELDRAILPAEYPAPSPADFPWWDFPSLLAEVSSAIDDEALDGLGRAIGRWEGWSDFTSATGRDLTVVCHGDVHPGNVMMGDDGPILIDWDLLCLAPAGWDHAPLMTWSARWGGRPGMYEEFADGYGVSMRGNRHAEAFAELRLVAATLMRVRAGIDDPRKMPEAQSRLAYWRGDPDAPAFRAQ